MNGIAALRQILAGTAGVTALVPATRIIGGDLPQGVELPAIGITRVSQVDRRPLAQGAMRRVTERIQATVMASTYPQAEEIRRTIKNAADYQTPGVNGISEVVVLAEGVGPDFTADEVSIPMQMQDFLVSFNEATS